MNYAQRGGGEAILTKDTINSKICNNFPIYGNGVMENITAKIFTNGIICKISTAYNSCKNVEEV